MAREWTDVGKPSVEDFLGDFFRERLNLIDVFGTSVEFVGR
jgi:hypothetical protein